MTRRIPLPTAETAAHALQDLTRQANVTGRRVSVSGLARRLGLPNTTLRRHYPDVIDEMGTAGPPQSPRPPEIARRGIRTDRQPGPQRESGSANTSGHRHHPHPTTDHRERPTPPAGGDRHSDPPHPEGRGDGPANHARARHAYKHVFEYVDADTRRLRPVGPALPHSWAPTLRGHARSLPRRSPAGERNSPLEQPSLREVHRIQPPHLALPRVRRLLDLARLRGSARLVRVARPTHPGLIDLIGTRARCRIALHPWEPNPKMLVNFSESSFSLRSGSPLSWPCSAFSPTAGGLSASGYSS